MSSNQPNQEIEVIAKLMEFVQSNKPKGREQPTLNFIFHQWSIGPYGEKESQWEATVHYPDHNITDYGYTVEQAAERLLELLLHPEKYKDED